jgi:hypothetical protein
MALLPPIPDRPADRPETWTEYLSRRAIVAMHRQFLDELAACIKREPPFDVFDYFFGPVKDAPPVLPAPRGMPIPLPYGSNRGPRNTVLIDEDVTWRDDAVRRLLADPSATDLFFTDAGVMQVVTDLDIDLEPELKELIPPAEAKWIGEEIERLGSELLSLAYANGLRILRGG